jgi:hypothetical protein
MAGTSYPSNMRTLTVKDAVYPKEGAILNYDSTSGSGTVDLTAATDVAHYVAADESSRDADGTLVAAGATITADPVGGMLYVLATASESWVCGQLLYVAAGVATKTAGSNKKLGLYVGDAVTTAASTLYPVNTNGADIA